MTVLDLRIRQKQSFGSGAPIQYFPESHVAPLARSILTDSGNELTTLPTATKEMFS